MTSNKVSVTEDLKACPYQMLDDPQAQAEFMLPRLNDAQRDFIIRAKPTLDRQRIKKRDHVRVWPGVETGEEWPDQFWFGTGEAHFPAGRPPLGNKRCSYFFTFTKAGLLLHEAIKAASPISNGNTLDGAGEGVR